MTAQTQYLVRGELAQTNGNVIPKYVYRISGGIVTCEVPQPPCYFDSEAKAKKVLSAMIIPRALYGGTRNWRIVVVPALVQPEIKGTVDRSNWTPRQWYDFARRVWSVYQDSLHGGFSDSDDEERWATHGAWRSIPKRFRTAAKATARPSAFDPAWLTKFRHDRARCKGFNV